MSKQEFLAANSGIKTDLTFKTPVVRTINCPIRFGTGGTIWAAAGYAYGLTTGATQYIVADFSIDETIDVDSAIDIYLVGFHNIAISSPNQDMGYNLQVISGSVGRNGNSADPVDLSNQTVELTVASLRDIQRFKIGEIPASTLDLKDFCQIRFDRISTGDEIANTFYIMGVQLEATKLGV